MRAKAEELIARYRVKTTSPDAPIETLSGGNVLRAVLARELSGDVDVLIVCQSLLRSGLCLCRRYPQPDHGGPQPGAAVLLVSEDLDEILELGTVLRSCPAARFPMSHRSRQPTATPSASTWPDIEVEAFMTFPVPAVPIPSPSHPAARRWSSIDMQRDFIEKGGFGDSLGNDVTRLEAIIPTTAKLIDLFRRKKWPIVHTREAHLPDLSDCPPSKIRRGDAPCGSARMCARAGFWCAASRQQIVDSLKPIAGEIVIDKPGKGMFWNTDIQSILDNKGVTHLVFAGVTTEVCVQTSMREANDAAMNAC